LPDLGAGDHGTGHDGAKLWLSVLYFTSLTMSRTLTADLLHLFKVWIHRRSQKHGIWNLTPTQGQACSVMQRQFEVATREQLQEVIQFIASKVWITYRFDFERLGLLAFMYLHIGDLRMAEPSRLTADRGWGCMLRCGQMMLAETLSRHRGVSHRRSILIDFADRPDACFSIHRITTAGAKLSVPIGQWFGPNTLAHALKFDGFQCGFVS
jgi:hypothetical protein